MNSADKLPRAHELFNLGLERIDEENFDAATTVLVQSLELAGPRPSILLNLAYCCIKIDEFKRALEYLEQIDTNDLQLRVDIARMNAVASYGLSNNHVNAEKIKHLYKLHPNDDIIKSAYLRVSIDQRDFRPVYEFFKNNDINKLDSIFIEEYLYFHLSIYKYEECINLFEKYNLKNRRAIIFYLESLVSLKYFKKFFEFTKNIDMKDREKFLYLNSCREICDWSNLDHLIDYFYGGELFDCVLGAGIANYYYPISLEKEFEIAQERIKRIETNSKSTPGIASNRHTPKVAYCSADFRNHPVAQLIAPVLEQHSSELDMIGIAYNHDTSTRGLRFQKAARHVIDTVLLNEDEAVAQMKAQNLDIAVDLTGATEGSRLELFNRRVAPVQIHYLGNPGMIAAPGIDYLIVDKFTAPPQVENLYVQSLIWMPDCSYVIEPKAHCTDKQVFLERFGLNDSQFVVGNHGNLNKLSEECFLSWLKILQEQKDAVLILGNGHDMTKQNLLEFTVANGVDAERLIFLPRSSDEEYLQRLSMLDLFLDTWPYCAQTTATDALNAGIPVLAKPGETIAQRIGGSLVAHVGTPELIAETPDEFVKIACDLATERSKIEALKRTVVDAKNLSNLFKPGVFARNLERAYDHVHTLRMQGKPPQSFAVEDLG